MPRLLIAAVLCLLGFSGMAFAEHESGSDGSGRSGVAQGYARITGPCGFAFPADHGAHPDHRTEWWYWTGNLEDRQSNRYGFQLTFFRRRLVPPTADRQWPEPSSNWRASQLYVAHAALSALGPGEHYTAQDMARGAAGLAGVAHEAAPVGTSDEAVQVFLKAWSASIGSERQELRVRAGDFALCLDLFPEKPPVAHGQDGYSKKGRRPESASCYYSFTRLRAEGSIEMNGRIVDVSGLAWMDHEYSSELLEADLVGWDWFSLQFDDQTELMAFFLRDGLEGHSQASGGSFVRPDASPIHLGQDDMLLSVLDYWTSPHTGARYPAGWRLEIPGLALDVTIRPAMSDQEMRTGKTTGVIYWEGSVRTEGMVRGRPIQGRGYVEMTGYAGSFDAPL